MVKLTFEIFDNEKGITAKPTKENLFELKIKENLMDIPKLKNEKEIKK